MATQTLTRRQPDASVTPPEPIEPLAGGNLETTMNGAMLLQHAAGVIEHRESVYGTAQLLFEQLATRCSLVLGAEVTPAQVVLCLVDLKLARLTHHPSHLDSIVDVAGYAACLREVIRA